MTISSENSPPLIGAKDAKQFHELYCVRARIVRTMSRSYRIAMEESEDLVQEAFIRLFLNWTSIEPGRHRGFLATVVRNLIVDGLRRRKSKPMVELSEILANTRPAPTSDDADLSELLTLMKGLIHELPQGRADEYFRLYYQNGLSVKDIAQRTGKSPGTITSQIKRTRDRIRPMIEDALKLHDFL